MAGTAASCKPQKADGNQLAAEWREHGSYLKSAGGECR